VLHAAAVYAWAGALLFGLGQYNLLSQLQHWSEGLMLAVTFVLSLALAVGMLLAGGFGSRPQRRRALLLAGSVLTLGSLLVLLLPEAPGGLRLVAGATFGLGLGPGVLAFPMAVAAAPPDRTAFVVAMVNTAGTLAGALLTLVSGWILQQAADGAPVPVLFVYGPVAVVGILLALATPRK
jgi:MFS family permease